MNASTINPASTSAPLPPLSMWFSGYGLGNGKDSDTRLRLLDILGGWTELDLRTLPDRPDVLARIGEKTRTRLLRDANECRAKYGPAA